MTESASPSPTPEDAAAAQARRRKERREAKIKAGGSARLNKITGLGGGVQRDPPATAPTPSQAAANPAAPQEHGDPDEVDISEHFYRPSVTQRPSGASPQPDAAAAEARLRQLLLAQQQQEQPDASMPPNPFLFGNAAGSGGGGSEADPMAAMLAQMMQAMGGGAAGGPGGAGGGFPGFPGGGGGGGGISNGGFPGFPGMGDGGAWPGQPQRASSAVPSTPAALWRLVHFAVAVALGLYVALATPFTGTQAAREQAALGGGGGGGGVGVAGEEDAGSLALRKRYFFYAFATAETVLLTSRIFADRRSGASGLGSVGGGGGGPGMLSMALGFLPPAVKRNVEIAMQYWQIFSTVRSDLLVCVFVLGVSSWLRS